MFREKHLGSVTVLEIAHGKANALDVELCLGLGKKIEEFLASSSRALVLTGNGNMFSAGVDLLRLLAEGAPYALRLLDVLDEMLEGLFVCSKPVVAAINGHAIAGGCIVACAADHRIMARGPWRTGVPELVLGVPFPPTALEVIRFAVAPEKLQQLLHGGQTYTPEEALHHGLVNELADPAVLVDRAVAEAERMAALSPRAFALNKRQLREPVMERIRSGRARCNAEVREIWTQPETLQAIRQYVERTFKKPSG